MVMIPPPQPTRPAKAADGWRLVDDSHFALTVDGRDVDVLELPPSIGHFSEKQLLQLLKSDVPASGSTGKSLKALAMTASGIGANPLKTQALSLRSADRAIAKAVDDLLLMTEMLGMVTAAAAGGPGGTLGHQDRVSLSESRQGAQVTTHNMALTHKSLDASRGFGKTTLSGTIGRADATGATVVQGAQDFLQVVDTGVLVVRLDRVSYVGSLYSKTFTYEDIAHCAHTPSTGRVSISPLTGGLTQHFGPLRPALAGALSWVASLDPAFLAQLRANDPAALTSTRDAFLGLKDGRAEQAAATLRTQIENYTAQLTPRLVHAAGPSVPPGLGPGSGRQD